MALTTLDISQRGKARGNQRGESRDGPSVPPGESSKDHRTESVHPGAAQWMELRRLSRGPGMPRQLEDVRRSTAEERAAWEETLGISSSPTAVLWGADQGIHVRKLPEVRAESPCRLQSRQQCLFPGVDNLVIPGAFLRVHEGSRLGHGLRGPRLKPSLVPTNRL